MHGLGHTRSIRRPDHLIHTPDAFIRTPLPGLERGVAIVHASPALGAAFTQYTVELEPTATFGESAFPGIQRFVYILSGAVDLSSEAIFRELTPGSFAYLPPGAHHTLTATEPSVLQIIDKPFTPLDGCLPPKLLVGSEQSIESTALNGDEDLQVRALLPFSHSHDFAVNTMIYAPGTALSQVEVHVMEHGLLMLEGGGIYRLNDQWYPVTAGDFIWMGPFCPQWFAAVGKTPAKYLIYKDFNRHPLA